MEQGISLPGMAPAFGTLVVTSLIVMGSPGPSTLSLTAVAAAFGVSGSLPYLLGLVLGTTGVLLAVTGGLLALLLSLPHAAPVLLAASTAYMAWLAFKIATSAPLGPKGAGARAPSLAGGLLLALANPKAYVAIAAVIANNRLGFHSPLIEAITKIAVLTGMIVVIHLAWLAAGAWLSNLLRHAIVARVVNVAFAAVLLGSALLAAGHF